MTDRDSTRRLVAERDRRHNTPRQMEVTRRPVSLRVICLTCRRSPNWTLVNGVWMHMQAHECAFDCAGISVPVVDNETCPLCGGALVEVEY